MTDAFGAHLRLGQLAALRTRQLLHLLFHYVVCSLKLLILFCLHADILLELLKFVSYASDPNLLGP